uniref:Uncharacterized protein n=1 Tax=Theileria annulata TaxID=5874 RepID=A0A3B0MGM3_THEAN
MRRHKPKIINEHSAILDEFNAENSQNIAESENNLGKMNDLMKINQDYNILNFDQMQNYNYDFNFIPEWFNTLPPSLSVTKGFVVDSLASLAHMGLMSLISTQAFQNSYCSVFSSETEKAVCLKNSIENINKIAQTGRQIMSLNFRVLAGGRMAKEALVSLNTLASDPQNVGMIKTLGSTIIMYLTLMRESVGDEFVYLLINKP